MENLQEADTLSNKGAEKAFLEVSINDLRSRQKEIMENDSTDAAQKQQMIDELVLVYLRAHNVQEDNADYIRYYDSVRALSYDNVSESTWQYGDWIDEEKTALGPNGFEKIMIAQQDLFGRHLTDSDDSEPAPPAEQLKSSAELEAAVAEAREKWATVSAKKQGRAISYTSDQQKAIRDDYQSKVNELISFELQDYLADQSVSDEDKNVAVVQYLFNEQETLRESTKEKLKGTKLNKFVEFMNKGNLPVRVVKGVTLGVAAGFLGTLLAGAAGAGLVAGGAIAASRFVKGYAAHDKEIGTKTFEEVADSERLADWTDEMSDDDRLESLSGYFDETFEDDTKNEQKKRRKAFIWGAGSVAVGATIGYIVQDFDSISDKIKAADERFSNWWNDTPNGSDSSGIGNNGEISGTDPQPNIPDPQDTDPGTELEPKWDFSEVGHDARWIEHGEGGFQTLQELGVPEEKWEAVWADAGEHFQDEGKTYVMDDGRFGWSSPGRMTNEDLGVLARAAARQGVDLDTA